MQQSSSFPEMKWLSQGVPSRPELVADLWVLNALGQGSVIQVFSSNGKWVGDHSHISQQSWFPSVLDFAV